MVYIIWFMKSPSLITFFDELPYNMGVLSRQESINSNIESWIK